MASNFAKHTVCKYCKNVYCDPRMLGCLHSYCLQCIEKIQNGRSFIACHSCNHLTPSPNGGVISLPQNIRLKEEIQFDNILQKVNVNPLPECGSCGDETSDSVAYCKDCCNLLCPHCWDVHKKANKFCSHVTFAIGDLKISQNDLLKTLPIPQCPDHTDKKQSFYCTECDVSVCNQCYISRHNTHHTIEVSEQVTSSRMEILQGIEGLLERRKRLEEVIKDVDMTKQKLEDSKIKLYSDVQNLAQKLRQCINEQEKDLLVKCRKIAFAKETRLSIQLKSLRSLLESMNHCYCFTSTATSQYSDAQFLSIARTIQCRTDSLQQQFNDTALDLCETPYIPTEVNTDALAQMVSEFMRIADQSPCSTAVIPSQRLGIGTEMKVKVTTRDSNGRKLNKGESVVIGILTCSSEEKVECPVSDNDDGTYLVSVIPQQLGQHQLSINVNGEDIQGSPFKLNAVAQRDYTELKDPIQTITGINWPMSIAFSDDGDMFVTSFSDHCIHVYDSSGKKKNTIGSEGSGKLQFEGPHGIDISGEVVYVAEVGGHRIHKLTTAGEFVGTLGEFKPGLGQFYHPFDVKISPDGRVYIADDYTDSIQVFHPDGTIFHVINGMSSGGGSFSGPGGIAFDLSGNVHVSGYYSDSVTVFTPSGQFVRQYNKLHTNSPQGIAIDPSGYSLVNNYSQHGTLSIFDPSGRFIHSVGGFSYQNGVSVSPDGSVWVADYDNNRLVKY